MLTFQQAFKKVLEHARPLKAERLALRECLGLVAAEDVVSREPFPAFDNSAVDGYAVSLVGLNGMGSHPEVRPFAGHPEGRRPEGSPAQGRLRRTEGSRRSFVVPPPAGLLRKTGNEGPPLRFRLKGEVPAGAFSRKVLKPGEAVRIFTGAPVPKGAQAVVMQEDTGTVLEPSLVVLKRPRGGENIRFRGEDFQRGKILVRKNEVLNPAQLALLAAAGFEKAKVYPAPRVSILATGNELLRPGESLKPGKIRDSNSILLEALVKQAGGVPQVFPAAGDDPNQIRRWVRKGLQGDVLLISGGVSVGKYDLVRAVFKKEGVRKIFWKVNIKPGKPLFFGRKGETLVFGLPGNPVSVFVTFTEFVKPAILKMRGEGPEREAWVKGRLTGPFQNGRRFHFVRVRCVPRKKDYAVTPLEGQGSHQLGTLALSNALLPVEPNRSLRRGQKVLVKMTASKNRDGSLREPSLP